MKITQFDKPTLRLMRPSIEKALSVLEAEFGIKVQLRGASFTETDVTYKFELAIINSNGQAETKSVTDFKNLAHHFGLDPADLGRKFKCQGEEYTISGLKPGASKRPILATNRTGKTFVFPVTLVKAGLLGPKTNTQLPASGGRKFGIGQTITITKNDIARLGSILPGLTQVPPPPAPSQPKAGATKRVWEIADALIINNKFNRADMIAACVAEGINPSTAATQLGKWKKVRGY